MPDTKLLMMVDDDRDDRFFFRKALSKLDDSYELVEAQDGVEALEQLRKGDQLPDYIFLDLNMPLMDGNECLAAIKSDDRLKEIPVIIYTTSNFESDIESTTRLGASHYMVKPAVISQLPAEIKNAIRTVEKLRH